MNRRKVTLELTEPHYESLRLHCESLDTPIATWLRTAALEKLRQESDAIFVTIDTVSRRKLEAIAKRDGMTLELWARLFLQAKSKGL